MIAIIWERFAAAIIVVAIHSYSISLNPFQ